MNNNHIFIFGGSGSLGNALINHYISNNIITVYSRDENKHWAMNLNYNSSKIKYIIGDVRDKNKIQQSLIRANPDHVIIAAALKHIEKCEFETNESINTNLIGTKNILDSIENLRLNLTNIKSVCFVSTDKACSPVNIYGMCKAISEGLMIEKAKYIKDIKFVTVRYGNVLNSRGSIIPILHSIGRDPNKNTFNLTDERMTRFIMTLQDSVNLIEYAILNASSGDIVIPKLFAMRIKDLIDIFSDLYNKKVVLSTMRPGEKIHESLINETQSIRTHNVVFNQKNAPINYVHIHPTYDLVSNNNTNVFDYNSSQDLITKQELLTILHTNNLLDKTNEY